MKSFFGISGEDGNLTYNKGWEKIPENWYRTPVDYGLVDLNLDTIAFITKYPELGRYDYHLHPISSPQLI